MTDPDEDEDPNKGPDEYPTEDELPDEHMSIEDTPLFTPNPDDYDDINEFVKAEQEAQQNEEDEDADGDE